jgi:hypothetical protein
MSSTTGLCSDICDAAQVYNEIDDVCDCPGLGEVWDRDNSLCECPQAEEWNTVDLWCECPEGEYWDLTTGVGSCEWDVFGVFTVAACEE